MMILRDTIVGWLLSKTKDNRKQNYEETRE